MRTITRRARALAVVCLAIFLSQGAGAQNLVFNPGFETGDLSGWSLSGNTGYMSVDGAVEFVHSGSYAFTAGPVGSLGYLSQGLATAAGAAYDLEFWLGADTEGGETPNQFEVYWDGNLVYSETDSPVFPYTHYALSGLVASGTSTELKFGFRHDPAIWLFDDVSVMQGAAAVPEPDGMAPTAVGIPLLAFVLRRRLRGKA